MKNNQRTYIFLLAILILVLSACNHQASTISAQNVWSRPGLKDGNSAIFMSIHNETSDIDKLIAVKSEIASAVEIHKTISSDGVMKMVPQEFVSILPGESVRFEPGGLHIMLIGLKSNLQPGDEFDISLIFERAGEMDLLVQVKEP